MTPPAQSAARGRASTPAGRGEAAAADPAPHVPATRRRARQPPRRAHTGATTRFRPATAPRRVSGPGRASRRPAPRPAAPVGRRLVARLAALPDHPLVDRAVRGRAWIAVVGTLLIGIVALQVSMLRINAASSRAVERSSALERDNARLETLIAGMSAPDRIRAKAEKLGLSMPQVEEVRYVPAGGGRGAAAAATAIRTGAFAPQASSSATGTDQSSGDQSGAGQSTAGQSATDQSAAAVADGAGTMTVAEAQAALNDGDPSNDTQAMLNDGDPSNDAQAILNDGDPSNDGQASAGGDGTGAG